MAFTTHLIRSTPNNVETAVKTYLDAQSITTMHTISVFRYGQEIWVFIVFE